MCLMYATTLHVAGRLCSCSTRWNCNHIKPSISELDLLFDLPQLHINKTHRRGSLKRRRGNRGLVRRSFLGGGPAARHTVSPRKCLGLAPCPRHSHPVMPWYLSKGWPVPPLNHTVVIRVAQLMGMWRLQEPFRGREECACAPNSAHW